MISPISPAKANLERSASDSTASAAELHIFECGQGDTLLLGLSCGKWALIDCNLPDGEPRRRFLDAIARLGVTRLDLVCLTHPHDDHYTGLESILRHFMSGGRSVGTFCDSGIEPKQIATLMRRRARPDASVRAYESLYRYVWTQIDNGSLAYFRADENSRAIIFGEGDAMQLLPVGPRPDVLGTAIRDSLTAGRIRTDLNRISVILALVIRTDQASFDALLSADANAKGINAAIEKLKGIKQGSVAFDVVKVSHHGSLDSHLGAITCTCRKDGLAIAAVSTGPFDVLPDRVVLEEYLDHGWTVLLTTKRHAGIVRTPLALSGRLPTTTTSAVQEHNLAIRWAADSGLSWDPPAAQLQAQELANYQTARKTH